MADWRRQQRYGMIFWCSNIEIDEYNLSENYRHP